MIGSTGVIPDHLGAHIYQGFWINWTHGVIRGSTLTLSASRAGLLSAFLAIFVALTGTAFWRVSSFAIHQFRAKKGFQDCIHQQQQLILRNTETPSGAFWQMVQLSYSWRKRAKSPWLRTLPLALLALTNLIIFIVAGIFSSEVTRAPGKGVLIQSENCGSLTFDLSNGFTREVSAAFNSVILNDTTLAASYVRSCYGSDFNVLKCDRYVKPQVQWKTNMNASCPFGDNICLYGNTSAIEMDTGLIDSHYALGINAPQTDRVQYRKVSTCSPLRLNPYHALWNDTDPTHIAYRDTFDRYFLGTISGYNFTYEYNRHGIVENIGYSLKSFISTSSDDPWIPIPALHRDDADVSLFFLSANSISYADPVSDPLFSANIPESFPTGDSDGKNMTFYNSDHWVTGLACIDQHQYCNLNNLKCTPLMGSNRTLEWLEAVGLNNRQMAVVGRIAPDQLALSMYYSVNGRGSSALRAQESLYELIQQGLPNNQWMIEVSSWFAIGAAKLQELVVKYATGPQNVPAGTQLLRPTLAADKRQCESQVVLSPGGTVSFSVLGVSIILIVGTLTLLLNSFLSRLTARIRRGLQFSDYKRMQWGLDGVFQLHRLAYEQAGQGTWSGGAGTIPVTQPGDLIGVPNNQPDELHPKLVRHDDGGQFSYQPPPMGAPMGDGGSQFPYRTPSMGPLMGDDASQYSYWTPSMGSYGQKTPLFQHTSVDPDYRV